MSQRAEVETSLVLVEIPRNIDDRCVFPDNPWQLFEPESVDAIYADGDPAFWPDTSGNGRDIDGVIVGFNGVPAPYRPNLLNGFGGIALGPPEWNDPRQPPYDAPTFYSERAKVEDGAQDASILDDIGPGLSAVMVARRDLMGGTFSEAAIWAPTSGTVAVDTRFYLGFNDSTALWFADDRTTSESVNASTPADDWVIISGSSGPDGSRLWLNGVEAATGAGIAGPWNHLWTFYYPGDQAVYFGIWPRAFTEEEHRCAHEILMAKFGLS